MEHSITKSNSAPDVEENDLTRHQGWHLYNTQEAMTQFLSELIYPSKSQTTGASIYLFSGVPTYRNTKRNKQLYSMHRSKLRHLRGFKDTIFNEDGSIEWKAMRHVGPYLCSTHDRQVEAVERNVGLRFIPQPTTRS